MISSLRDSQVFVRGIWYPQVRDLRTARILESLNSISIQQEEHVVGATIRIQ